MTLRHQSGLFGVRHLGFSFNCHNASKPSNIIDSCPDNLKDLTEPDPLKLHRDEIYRTKMGQSFHSQRLVHNMHVEDAQHLLYRVYIEEMGWRYAPNNPSGFRVVEKNGRKCLCDSFDNSALWIGGFEHDKLVSVQRVLYRAKSNRLDIEGYPFSQHPAIQRKLQLSNIVELQRSATEASHRGLGVCSLIFLTICNMLLPRRIPMIVCSKYSTLNKSGLVLHSAFDYGDGEPTVCCFFDAVGLQNLSKNATKKILEKQQRNANGKDMKEDTFNLVQEG